MWGIEIYEQYSFFENEDLDFLLFCMRYQEDDLDKIELYKWISNEEKLEISGIIK